MSTAQTVPAAQKDAAANLHLRTFWMHVAGDRDTSCTTDILHRAARGINGAHLEVLPGVTHAGVLIDPTAVRAIASFLMG